VKQMKREKDLLDKNPKLMLLFIKHLQLKISLLIQF